MMLKVDVANPIIIKECLLQSSIFPFGDGKEVRRYVAWPLTV